jgi:hypothetical protein
MPPPSFSAADVVASTASGAPLDDVSGALRDTSVLVEVGACSGPDELESAATASAEASWRSDAALSVTEDASRLSAE